ncbi:MAG: TolB family protein [Planctomycetota bacterium]|jgi:hypothetical protein
MIAIAAALTLSGGLASAKKPPKPPPDPANRGVIYYLSDGVMHEMDTDGTDKTALTDVTGLPSQETHGGERWFLQLKPITGDTYPNDFPRYELYAVSETGTSVRLTSASDIEPSSTRGIDVDGTTYAIPQWAKLDDTMVSYAAKKWANGEVVEWGFYVHSIDPDDLASHTAGTPTRVPVPVDLLQPTESHGGFVNSVHGWSPDATAVIYQRWQSNRGMWGANAAGGWTPSLLTTDVFTPHWSPNGTKIAFEANGIETMNPDGSGRTTIITNLKAGSRRGHVLWPCWSPTGSHLIFGVNWWKGKGAVLPVAVGSDVYRAEDDGSNQVDLTGDTDAWAFPVRWCDE